MSKKHLISLIILIIAVSSVFYIMTSKPSANKRGARPPASMTVETLTIKTKPYQVTLESFGRISAKVQGQLNAQVGGKITSVNDNFNTGSFFKRGDVLATIDARDYNIRVEAAQAEVAQAQVAFNEEQALSAQAIKDRRDIGTINEASDFALRKPQMAAAKAKLQAATANLKQAQLDVERTQIIAPYDGRILNKHVDVGQVVSSNTNIADIYATARVEVKLPIKNSHLALIDLPNNQQLASQNQRNKVSIINSIGGEPQIWTVDKQRTSAGIDNNTQQINIIGEIPLPFATEHKRSLNLNQFVTAKIEGRTLDNAIVIPNSAIYQGSYVYLYVDGAVQRQDVSIAFQNKTDALISTGIDAGMALITTPLGQITSGTKVKLLGAKPAMRGKGEKRREGKNVEQRKQRKQEQQ